MGEARVGIWRVVKATVNHKPRTFLRPIKVFCRPGTIVEYRGKSAAIGDAISDSAPTPLSTLLNAKRKPKNTSATRWRMELARRADPGRFAIAGVAVR